jgi:hypothetical protein
MYGRNMMSLTCLTTVWHGLPWSWVDCGELCAAARGCDSGT